MSRITAPSGKHPLAALYSFDSTKHGFYQNTVDALRDSFLDAYRTRTEFIGGGVVSAGAGLLANALRLTFASGAWYASYLRGVPNQSPVATTDTNLNILTDTGNVGAPVYGDGAGASAHSLATDETAHFAIIGTNSDSEGDVGNAQLVVVFKGTAETAVAAEAPPSSAEIQRALAAATGVHDHADVVWFWIASGVWSNPGGTPAVEITMNVNNTLNL